MTCGDEEEEYKQPVGSGKLPEDLILRMSLK